MWAKERHQSGLTTCVVSSNNACMALLNKCTIFGQRTILISTQLNCKFRQTIFQYGLEAFFYLVAFNVNQSIPYSLKLSHFKSFTCLECISPKLSLSRARKYISSKLIKSKALHLSMPKATHELAFLDTFLTFVHILLCPN